MTSLSLSSHRMRGQEAQIRSPACWITLGWGAGGTWETEANVLLSKSVGTSSTCSYKTPVLVAPARLDVLFGEGGARPEAGGDVPGLH